jgi:Flp pilus assembly pilin Flp
MERRTATGNLLRALHRLHRCERGAEGLEKLLIIGAVALPLLGLLLLFRDKITELLSSQWSEVAGDVESDTDLADP